MGMRKIAQRLMSTLRCTQRSSRQGRTATSSGQQVPDKSTNCPAPASPALDLQSGCQGFAFLCKPPHTPPSPDEGWRKPSAPPSAPPGSGGASNVITLQTASSPRASGLQDMGSQVELSGYYEAENTTPSLEGYFCFNPASSMVGNQGDPFRKVFMPLIYLLMFVLGTLGNALVLVILERFKRSRTTTENFLFHLTLANLALLFTFPFSVVESLAGWIFGKFLCKILSAVHKINFYCSSMLLGCIAVDRYLAIVYAIHTYRKRRARSIHLTCTAVWLCSLLLTLPDLIFMEVWTDDSNHSICYFPEVGIDGNNAWLATRFLYHTVGFFVPLLVMCYCYMAIIRALCQSQRLQRQKAVRVAILVTGIFLLCWSPYHIVIFLNTLTKLEAFTKNCLLEDQLDTAIMVTEAIGFTHCCLNPILYAFIGVKFRNDFFRILQELGCISQETLQEILERFTWQLLVNARCLMVTLVGLDELEWVEPDIPTSPLKNCRHLVHKARPRTEVPGLRKKVQQLVVCLFMGSESKETHCPRGDASESTKRAVGTFLTSSARMAQRSTLLRFPFTSATEGSAVFSQSRPLCIMEPLPLTAPPAPVLQQLLT
ncbi:hypothetical protein IHE44_0008545 [Lamprotornis superbus]|uniref:C-X-C chemokine receptor type 5 n=1 Tax=Lamprotornis superbus TaxID=245042 RepID=A0A835TSY7_9PASS|nr:hypothetical protein IHE44_0008545 [Lamprotornis superbus]